MGYSFWLAARVLLYGHFVDWSHFIWTITDRIAHNMAFIQVVEQWLEQAIPQWFHHEGSIQQPIAPWANVLTTKLKVESKHHHLISSKNIFPCLCNPFSYFSFQPGFHNWCNIDCDMYYPVYVVVHVKYSLLLIRQYEVAAAGVLSLSKNL